MDTLSKNRRQVIDNFLSMTPEQHEKVFYVRSLLEGYFTLDMDRRAYELEYYGIKSHEQRVMEKTGMNETDLLELRGLWGRMISYKPNNNDEPGHKPLEAYFLAKIVEIILKPSRPDLGAEPKIVKYDGPE